MEIIKNFTVKKLMNAEPGELIQVAVNKKAALALVLRKTGSELHLGVLKWPERADPFTLVWAAHNPNCVSYGTEWVLQPVVGSETRAGNEEGSGLPGVLHFDGEDVIIQFAASPEGVFGGAVNLSTFQDSSIPYSALPIASWDLWTSRDSLNAGDSPLFSFGDTLRPKSGTVVRNG
jgi:hypothetical protein